ncbi:MAG: mechanosensitive ion channel protein MscS [delta proteobacterium MLS_D]|jgi:MscS family membrane protein|nr:MAG: mechanosensitive ion channel protein MscS [delta proteobacterium MLS_D]
MEFADIVKSLRTLAGEHLWITQVFVVIFVCLLLAFIQKVLLKRLHDRLLKTRYVWDDALVDAMRGPITVFIWLVGIAFAAQIVGYEADAPLFQAVEPLRDVGIIAVFAWFTIRFIRMAQDNIMNKRIRRGETFDPTTADAISKLLKISVVITALLVILQTLGFSLSGVLAFGGVGGIAVGFAARDLLANFFGGLIIYLDRPFAVGEWVRSPDREIEGTVEEIGWRLTRIRTFDKRPLYVPNAAFTTITLQNPSRMTNRRIFETIGVRYDDAGRLKGILEDVRSMLQEHEDIDQGQLMMVYFNEYAASSLDFFVYCFTRTTVWAEYHRVKEDVLFRIMDIILAHGAEVAFPTSTLHVPEGIGVWEESATGTEQKEPR